MKNGSTLLLRVTLVGLGLIVSVMGAGIATGVNKHWALEFPDIAYAKHPIMVGLAACVIVFWVALNQAFKLLDLIDRNQSFSPTSVKTLQNIKYCALAFAGIFTTGMPAVFYIAEKDDAPGLVLIIGTIFIGVPVVVAVFAGVCQKLFQNAIDIKSENDLTV